MRSELLFFALTYTFSWSVWLAIAIGDVGASPLRNLAMGLAAAGPSVAGLLCMGRDEGRRGVRRLFTALLQWRLGAHWYALAIGGPLAVALVAIAVHRLTFGDDARFHLEATTVLLVPPALVAGLFIGPLQEELGWRGYALPRLLRRRRSLSAALVVGVPWACWHLPLYGIGDGGLERAPLALFLLSTVALSVVYTWFWVVTGGSLVIALVLHSATNTASVLLLKDARSDFGPSIVAGALTVALAALAALGLERPHAPVSADGVS